MNYEILGLVLAALFMISGGIATLYKMNAAIRDEREKENQKVLNQAKEYCDEKYKILENELNHQKELHEGKIVELSEKIEQLRDEMRRHHGQLVDLLSKMLEK